MYRERRRGRLSGRRQGGKGQVNKKVEVLVYGRTDRPGGSGDEVRRHNRGGRSGCIEDPHPRRTTGVETWVGQVIEDLRRTRRSRPGKTCRRGTVGLTRKT